MIVREEALRSLYRTRLDQESPAMHQSSDSITGMPILSLATINSSGKGKSAPVIRTSLVVSARSSLSSRLQRRKEFYKRLAAFLSNGGKLDDFDVSCITNENDRQHFEKLLLFLATHLPSDILTYVRDKDNITRKGIADALRKVQAPLIGMSYDPVCENIIQVLVENRADAQIFVDAYCWSEKTGASVFATTDVTDFVRNRVHIHKAMCNYKSVDLLENLPLRILHLDEIV